MFALFEVRSLELLLFLAAGFLAGGLLGGLFGAALLGFLFARLLRGFLTAGGFLRSRLLRCFLTAGFLGRLLGGFLLRYRLFGGRLFRAGLLFASLFTCLFRGRCCGQDAHGFRVHSTSSSARTIVVDVRRADGDASF